MDTLRVKIIIAVNILNSKPHRVSSHVHVHMVTQVGRGIRCSDVFGVLSGGHLSVVVIPIWALSNVFSHFGTGEYTSFHLSDDHDSKYFV